MKNTITLRKLGKYFSLTSSALKIAEKSVVKGKQKQAEEIFRMVSDYLSDAKYFEKNGNFVNAFAALNYAHGWLDAGVRLEVFDVTDGKLFTIK